MMTPQQLFARGLQMARDIGQVDLSATMNVCAEVLRDQVQREFAAEEDPFGKKWKPWYWTTEYPPQPHKTLMLSGVLYASFVTNQAGHIERVYRDGLDFGSSIKYAMMHQEGATFKLGIWLFGRGGGVKRPGDTITIPARPIVGWPTETIEQCADLVAQGIIEEWEREIPYEQTMEFRGA